jgi:predicted metalloprotease with PDZ domain
MSQQSEQNSMPMSAQVHYEVTALDPKGHLFQVDCWLKNPDPEGQVFRLPKWIPGSYLIRDFAKNVVEISAQTADGQPLAIAPVDLDKWQTEATESPLVITYQVYAWDLSVRGAHFDDLHAFFNGTSVFLLAEDQTSAPVSVTLNRADWMPKNWQVATSLEAVDVDPSGFGRYQSDSYFQLIDNPVEISDFTQVEFEAHGIPHKMVLSGQHDADTERLARDLKKICETEITLWGEPAPIESYLFIVLVTDKGYGGLEHQNNTVLMCDRNDLPYSGMQKPTEAYLNFLELCAHEYFHLWNVKRLQPKAYQEADLSAPVLTEQLWWFEGVTSYYDGLMLYRAGLIDAETYLARLSKEMTRVYRMPGRFKLSVSDASYLTWTKFYQQDENAPNAIISYYTKGALIALALDLTIRAASQGRHSLDDVLRGLWQHYGAQQKGLEEREIEAFIEQFTGLNLETFFERYLYGTEDLPLPALLINEGVEMTLRPPLHHKDLGGLISEADKNQHKLDDTQAPIHLGANLTETEHQTLKVTHVWQDGIAYQAGLAAGDEIVAVKHLRTGNIAELESLLQRQKVNDELACHYFRQGVLRETTLSLTPHIADRVVLKLDEKFAEVSVGHWL